MKPRFCVAPVGVSDAADSAWRTYSMLTDAPGKLDKLALEAYLNRLIVRGERNQDRLTLKALIYLKKRESRVNEV